MTGGDFDAINAAGGVHGRKIVYKPIDDGFEVKRTVENIRKLVPEDKAFLIYNNTDSFIKGMETGGDISFGKFVAHYSPASHSGSSYVELAIMDAAGQLRY